MSSQQLTVFNKYNLLFGYKDSKTGKEIVPAKYNKATAFSEKLAVVCIKDKYGFINKSGKLEIPLKFDYALPFSEGLAAVGKGSDIAEGYKWGFIDRTGKLIIPFQYDEVSSFKNGKVSVTVGYEYFKIDKNGKKIE